MKAHAFRSERASQRAKRMAKTRSASPEPATNASDPIDEEIASLLESVSSKHEAQLRGQGISGQRSPTALPSGDARTARRRARVSRRNRPTETVSQALSRIAIDLPRPYLSYAVRQVFSLMAVVLLSVALGFLIVYLVSP